MGRGLDRDGIDQTRKPGRPPKVPPMELLERLETYIAVTDVPKVAEFAYLNDYDVGSLYDIPEISQALKKLIAKKTAVLEDIALQSGRNSGTASAAIFSLKQLGWSDKQEIAHSGGVHLTRILDDVPKEKKE